ncbi:hypothetical protein [Alishewanella longhuensis]
MVYVRFTIWQLGLDGNSCNLTPDSRNQALQLLTVQTYLKALALTNNAKLLLRGFNV